METEIAQQAVSAAGSGPSLVTSLLEYGSLGIFAIFLIWQHVTMIKRSREDQSAAQDRADSLVERFEVQLASIQTKYEEREDNLRSRYDIVIADLNANRDTLKNEIHTSLTGVSGKIDTALGKLDDGLTEIREIRQQSEIRRIQRLAGSTTQQ